MREEGEQLGAEWSSEKEGNYSIGFNIIIMMDFHTQKTSSSDSIIVMGRSQEPQQQRQQD